MSGDEALHNKLLSRINGDPKLQAFEKEPNGVVYFYKDDIGHPESVLVTKAPNGDYRIFEISHQYDAKTQVRGNRAFLASGGEGAIYFGREIKTGDPVAVKKGSLGRSGEGPANAYKLAAKLQHSVNSPVIGLYGYGVSGVKPAEKRSAEKRETHTKEKAFYAIMEMGSRTLEKGNLELAPAEKKAIFLDALRFGFLLERNNCTFQDYKDRNVLLDKQNRFKVCDLEGLTNYAGAQKSPFSYALQALNWVYAELPPEDRASVKQDIEKLTDFSKSINSQNFLTDKNFNDAIDALIKNADSKAKAAVSQKPVSNDPPQKQNFTREYGIKDILMADLSYYAQKNEIKQVIDICLQLQHTSLKPQELNNIEQSLLLIAGKEVNELLEHPELFKFPPVAVLLVAKLSNDKQIEIIQQAAKNPGTIPDTFVLQLATQYYQAQGNGELSTALGNLQRLNQLLEKFDNKEIIALNQEVQQTIIQCDKEIKSIETIQKNTEDKNNITNFIQQFNSFLNDETKHPASRKSTFGRVLGGSAVNLAQKQRCEYALKGLQKNISNSKSPLTDQSAHCKTLANHLNTYLNALLDNLNSPFGNKPQTDSRYLTALKTHFGIEGDIPRNYFTTEIIKDYASRSTQQHGINEAGASSTLKLN